VDSEPLKEMIQKARIKALNKKEVRKGAYVLYWMQDNLNNKYELDGRDPNGFTGVAWCFGKHDRPWGERPIFGNVRYMNDKGLKRKFDADRYVKLMDLDKKH